MCVYSIYATVCFEVGLIDKYLFRMSSLLIHNLTGINYTGCRSETNSLFVMGSDSSLLHPSLAAFANPRARLSRSSYSPENLTVLRSLASITS